VASFLVRGLDDALVKALKARAGEHGHSAEAEHRLILKRRLNNRGGEPLRKFSHRCPTSGATKISSASNPTSKRPMYLIDTNIVSESRKRGRANSGVIDFFERATLTGQMLYFAAVALGELRLGFETIQIAVIALVNNLTVDTRHFLKAGVLNPFSAEPSSA
jgi:plasmid stability protein/predicted nucleic acid-binding protein